ncbi:MAG: metal ABC transporter permease [Chloroflexota bacterium]|nr:metal ABC transporter permease [Chloroflexota bacterium]
MIDALQYEYMQRALLTAVLASIVCGIIGVYIVVRKMVFISGGISHASFGGIGLGWYLGINPLLGAMLFAIFSALSMGFVSRRIKIAEDTLIGIMWAVGMALGILFIDLKPGYADELFGYLIGDILFVSPSDVGLIAIIALLTTLTVILLYKEFLALSFDEEFGTVVGAPMNYLYYVLLCLIAITVVVLIKVVGIILVIALLTIPSSIASRYTHKLWLMMLLSIVIGIFFTITGLWLSYETDIASGATIILTSATLFLLSLIISRKRHKSRDSTA